MCSIDLESEEIKESKDAKEGTAGKGSNGCKEKIFLSP